MAKSNRRKGTGLAARISPVYQEKVKKVGAEHLGLLTIDSHKPAFEALL